MNKDRLRPEKLCVEVKVFGIFFNQPCNGMRDKRVKM